MDIEAVRMFLILAKKLNFTESAKLLDVSQPTLSRKIKLLEKHLNVTLFHRRGSTITLTPSGETFLSAAEQIIYRIDAVVEDLNSCAQTVSGNIRLGVLPTMARVITQGFLPEFHKKYPDISFHFHTLTPQLLTAFEEVDIMISPIRLDDDTVIAKKICDLPRYCYASPKYLSKHGMPKVVDDLEHHQCITQTHTVGYERYWNFHNTEGKSKKVPVSGKMTTNSIDIAINLAVEGFGIGLLPKELASKYVDEGKLIQLFPDNIFVSNHLIIMYKQSYHTPKRFQVFIDEYQKFFSNIDQYAL